MLFQILGTFVLLALLNACGEGEIKGKTGKGPLEIPPLTTPTAFGITAMDGQLLVHFQSQAAAKEYRLYFGDDTSLSGLTGVSVPSPYVTTANSISVKGLNNGDTYYFAVEAVGLDGVEVSPMTTILSGIPTQAPPTYQQYEMEVEFQACANTLDIIKFEEGKFKLTYHEGNHHLNQSNKCKDNSIKIKTTESLQSGIYVKTYTWQPWINNELDLNIPGFKVDGLHTISMGTARYVRCNVASSKLAAAVFGVDENQIPNLFKFDGKACGKNDITEYTLDKQQELTFKLHFYADPNLYDNVGS